MLIFTVIFSALFLIKLFYLKYASAKGIIDYSNNRKLHLSSTVTGGGVIYIPAIFLFILFFYRQIDVSLICFLLASLIIATVSFIDDLKTLTPTTRVIFQCIATTIFFLGNNFFDGITINKVLVVFCSYILILGYSNIYNFMDGINGMAFLNALCSYITLYIINSYLMEFTNSNLLLVFILATIVFGCFNFRTNPKCFLGDVGSITMGFTIIIFTLKLYLATNNIIVFLILGVNVLDGGLTILERLYRKENIFKPHLRHLYELFANKIKTPHLLISSIYFLSQAALNAFVYFSIKNNYESITSFIIFSVSLSLFYIVLKRIAYKNIELKNETN